MKGPSWTWHEITHILSGQEDQRESEDSEKEPWHEITHSLSSQQDQSGGEDSEELA